MLCSATWLTTLWMDGERERIVAYDERPSHRLRGVMWLLTYDQVEPAVTVVTNEPVEVQDYCRRITGRLP